ncbi:MAG: YmdB family metallophosphoesterase [Treponema sp.]|nr:YmdB family metallophosphoesterase [Treponema sp.]
MAYIKVIAIGDVVGEPGLLSLERELPGLIRNNGADFTMVNGENAAAGFGMTQESFRRILHAGADVVTSGNHVWEKKDFWPFLDSEERLLRPGNYPGKSPGRGWVLIQKAGLAWLVINLQGREYMSALDCPFRAFDEIIAAGGKAAAALAPDTAEAAGIPAPVVLVDFHAESAREKEALGYYLDGRAAMVVGTHTHVQTADERVLPKGTGYITDLGMTGVQDAVIGMDTKICLDRARTQILYRMEVAKMPESSDCGVRGLIAELDPQTGRAVSVKRIPWQDD